MLLLFDPFRIVFEYVARFALQRLADAGKGGEADGVYFVVFDLRQIYVGDPDAVCQIVQRHVATRHHDVKFKKNFSNIPLKILIVL